MVEVNLEKGKYDQLEKYVVSVNNTLEKIRSFTANLMDLRHLSSSQELIYFDRVLLEVVEYLRPQKRFSGVEVDLLDADRHVNLP